MVPRQVRSVPTNPSLLSLLLSNAGPFPGASAGQCQDSSASLFHGSSAASGVRTSSGVKSVTELDPARTTNISQEIKTLITDGISEGLPPHILIITLTAHCLRHEEHTSYIALHASHILRLQSTRRFFLSPRSRFEVSRTTPTEKHL